MNDLDHDIEALRRIPPSRRLNQLEALVWRRIAEAGQPSAFTTAGGPAITLHASVATFALVLGLLVGAALSAPPQDNAFSVFSVRAPHALSTLLRD